WESEAYPLGNGRLGIMLFSDPLKDQIQFNEESFGVVKIIMTAGSMILQSPDSAPIWISAISA
ncbi:glycoside hydrolase N-terminal domain-containing protein, partial [Cronobacter dublinensis]